MRHLAIAFVVFAAASGHAADMRPAGRTTVVSLLGDELLTVPGTSRADAEVLLPAATPRKATLTIAARCAGRCAARPRMLSVRIVGDGGVETEIARVQPAAAGGAATIDVSRHAALLAGSRTVRVLVDSLRANERGGWRVDATLTLESIPPVAKKPRVRVAAR